MVMGLTPMSSQIIILFKFDQMDSGIIIQLCFPSFNMAHSFLENVDDVDVISDAEVFFTLTTLQLTGYIKRC